MSYITIIKKSGIPDLLVRRDKKVIMLIVLLVLSSVTVYIGNMMIKDAEAGYVESLLGSGVMSISPSSPGTGSAVTIIVRHGFWPTFGDTGYVDLYYGSTTSPPLDTRWQSGFLLSDQQNTKNVGTLSSGYYYIKVYGYKTSQSPSQWDWDPEGQSNACGAGLTFISGSNVCRFYVSPSSGPPSQPIITYPLSSWTVQNAYSDVVVTATITGSPTPTASLHFLYEMNPDGSGGWSSEYSIGMSRSGTTYTASLPSVCTPLPGYSKCWEDDRRWHYWVIATNSYGSTRQPTVGTWEFTYQDYQDPILSTPVVTDPSYGSAGASAGISFTAYDPGDGPDRINSVWANYQTRPRSGGTWSGQQGINSGSWNAGTGTFTGSHAEQYDLEYLYTGKANDIYGRNGENSVTHLPADTWYPTGTNARLDQAVLYAYSNSYWKVDLSDVGEGFDEIAPYVYALDYYDVGCDGGWISRSLRQMVLSSGTYNNGEWWTQTPIPGFNFGDCAKVEILFRDIAPGSTTVRSLWSAVHNVVDGGPPNVYITDNPLQLGDSGSNLIEISASDVDSGIPNNNLNKYVVIEEKLLPSGGWVTIQTVDSAHPMWYQDWSLGTFWIDFDEAVYGYAYRFTAHVKDGNLPTGNWGESTTLELQVLDTIDPVATLSYIIYSLPVNNENSAFWEIVASDPGGTGINRVEWEIIISGGTCTYDSDTQTDGTEPYIWSKPAQQAGCIMDVYAEVFDNAGNSVMRQSTGNVIKDVIAPVVAFNPIDPLVVGTDGHNYITGYAIDTGSVLLGLGVMQAGGSYLLIEHKTSPVSWETVMNGGLNYWYPWLYVPGLPSAGYTTFYYDIPSEVDGVPIFIWNDIYRFTLYVMDLETPVNIGAGYSGQETANRDLIDPYRTSALNLDASSDVNNNQSSTWWINLADDESGVDWAVLYYAFDNDSYVTVRSAGVQWSPSTGTENSGTWRWDDVIGTVWHTLTLKTWVVFRDNQVYSNNVTSPAIYTASEDKKKPEIQPYDPPYTTFQHINGLAAKVWIYVRDEGGLDTARMRYYISTYVGDSQYWNVWNGIWYPVSSIEYAYPQWNNWDGDSGDPLSGVQFHYIKYEVEVTDLNGNTNYFDFGGAIELIDDWVDPTYDTVNIDGCVWDQGLEKCTSYDTVWSTTNSTPGFSLVAHEDHQADTLNAKLHYRVYSPWAGGTGWTAWTVVSYGPDTEYFPISYNFGGPWEYGVQIEWYVEIWDLSLNTIYVKNDGNNFIFEVTIDDTPPDLSDFGVVTNGNWGTASVSFLVHENGTGFKEARLEWNYFSTGEIKNAPTYDVIAPDTIIDCSDVTCDQMLFSTATGWIDSSIEPLQTWLVPLVDITVIDYTGQGYPNLQRWILDTPIPRRPFVDGWNQTYNVIRFIFTVKDNSDNVYVYEGNYTINSAMPIISPNNAITGMSNIEETVINSYVITDYGYGGIPLADYRMEYSIDGGQNWLDPDGFTILDNNGEVNGFISSSAEATINPMIGGTVVDYQWIANVLGDPTDYVVYSDSYVVQDKVPPLIDETPILSGYEGISTDFTLDIVDTGVGLGVVQLLYNNGGDWTIVIVPSATSTYSFSIPGFNTGDIVTWKIMAYDNVTGNGYGNFAEVNGQYVVTDGQPPTITINGPVQQIVGETGREYIDEATYVEFSNTYDNPVVFITPEINDTEARSGSLTAQNYLIFAVSDSGFWVEYMDDNSTAADGAHAAWLNWMVFEEGIYRLGSLKVEVGTIQLAGNYESVTFNNTYSTTPSVISASQTDYNNQPVYARINNSGITGFDVQLEAGNDSSPLLIYDTVGYIVVESGIDATLGIEAGTTTVTDSFGTVTYTLNYAAMQKNPMAYAQLSSENEADASYVVVKGNSTIYQNSTLYQIDFDVAVEEPVSLDGTHASETVTWIVLPEGIYTSGIFNNQSVTIEATVVDTGSDIISITIEYQIDGGGWVTEVMTLSAQDTYIFDLPVVTDQLVEVKITAIDFYANEQTSIVFSFRGL